MFSGECLTELGPDEHKLENERRREKGPWLGRERQTDNLNWCNSAIVQNTLYITSQSSNVNRKKSMMNLKILS